MKRKFYFGLLAFSIVCMMSSCSTSYIMSPLDSSSQPYVPSPVRFKGEPAKTETYFGIQPLLGFDHNNFTDGFGAFNFTLAQGNAVGPVRLSYATNLFLGSYYMYGKTNWGDSIEYFKKDHKGYHDWGGIGTNLAISIATPLRNNKGEWRIIGLQGAAYREFGEYADIRQRVPQSYAYDDVGVQRKKDFLTAGVFTEFVQAVSPDRHYGFKFAFSPKVLALPLIFQSDGYQDDVKGLTDFFSLTHFQKKKNCYWFVQVNIGITLISAQFGLLYIIHKL